MSSFKNKSQSSKIKEKGLPQEAATVQEIIFRGSHCNIFTENCILSMESDLHLYSGLSPMGRWCNLCLLLLGCLLQFWSECYCGVTFSWLLCMSLCVCACMCAWSIWRCLNACGKLAHSADGTETDPLFVDSALKCGCLCMCAHVWNLTS